MCVITDFEESVRKLSNYVQLDTILNETKQTPFWIKDNKFRFLRVNQAICNILYPQANTEDLIGKTDWEYVKSIGCSEDIVTRTKECCVYSDKYVLNSNSSGEKFYEKVVNTNGDVFWLLTTKERIPPEADAKKAFGIYGTAIVFPLAEKIIAESIQPLEKISENVYRIIETERITTK